MRTDTDPQRTLYSRRLVELKAVLLSHGVRPTSRFLRCFGRPFLEKRRAYGNPDALEFRNRLLPQELYLLPDRLICAVNIRADSPWQLDCEEGRFFVQEGASGPPFDVTFPLRPSFYDKELSSRQRVSSLITLYGGGSLGIFVYGDCSLVDMGKACQYCSIEANRSRVKDFDHVVTEARMREALSIALQDESAPLSQVMINGGNFPDLDRSFAYYARMASAAREVVDASGRQVELHLIVYPPRDLALIELLRGLRVEVAMNTEVYDPGLFARYCPGKAAVLGQQHHFAALREAVRVLGPGRVHSILVGGLEPLQSLERGLWHLASLGVTPIINVFHADPETPLERHPTPTPHFILQMGSQLQRVFTAHPFMRPFYSGCGRNSLDSEAYQQLFGEVH